jgi:serine phosphatase RsbU (regulator of sigma subunit)
MTDGLMETQNRSGEEFGMDKAELFLSERCKDPARVILDGLREAVRVFEHDEQLRDDVTAVVVKVLPDEAQPG